MNIQEVEFALDWMRTQEPPVTIVSMGKPRNSDREMFQFVGSEHSWITSFAFYSRAEAIDYLNDIRRSLEPAILRMRGGK